MEQRALKTLEGIYVPSERRAYFPDGSPLGRNNFSIDRIRNMLTQRGILRYEKDPAGRPVANYQIIKYTVAKELGYEITMVPVSPHVGKVLQSTKS